MNKIEATGSTKAQALNALDLKRLDVMRQTNATFLELNTYGNSEFGYKVVQYYKTKI